jgi:hypothetical protein
MDWAKADKRLRSVVAEFAGVDGKPVDKFGRFSDAAETAESEGLVERAPASVLGVGSLFGFAVDPASVPLVRARVFEICERAVGFDPAPKSSTRDRYAHHLRFADEAHRRLEAAGSAS